MSTPDWSSASVGWCDMHDADDKPVVAFAGEDATAACERCYLDAEAAWAELSPEEQAAVFAEALHARASVVPDAPTKEPTDGRSRCGSGRI